MSHRAVAFSTERKVSGYRRAVARSDYSATVRRALAQAVGGAGESAWTEGLCRKGGERRFIALDFIADVKTMHAGHSRNGG